MKTLTTLTLLLALLFGLISLYGQIPDYKKLKNEAEVSYAEGSYAQANKLYSQALALALSSDEKRWVDFRIADTLWRSQAATQTSDSTKFDQARHQLEALVRDIQREEDRDLVWAEVHESLGDFWWTRKNSRNWGEAWLHYQQALNWWAGSSDLDRARERYLKIVWTLAKPAGVERYYTYGNYGNVVPLEILENALKIAQKENDKSHVHFLIAMTLRSQSAGVEQRLRIPEEFEAALKAGKSSDWYDDALYSYAEWLANSGHTVILEDGREQTEPNYVKALDLFRRLINEYQKGETRYYEQARQQINEITKPLVSVGVSNIFLPNSEIQFVLNWRNIKQVHFALYELNLTEDVQYTSGKQPPNHWIQSINVSRREALRTWVKGTHDTGDYRPGSEMIRLDAKLPVGAYLLEARANGASTRDLILVTDASLILKTSGNQALVYFCNALDGSPIAEAKVTLWEVTYNYQNQTWIAKDTTKTTNIEGIAVFDLAKSNNNIQIFVSAISSNHQAFSIGNSYLSYREQAGWRIYAFTDRPAYRPGETAQWKFIARKYNGSVYSTPSNQTIQFEINDPRGTKVKESQVTLNAFGSAWGALELTDAMPLGEYRITFWDEPHGTSLGTATLFRLEEYKLPEFKVSVSTPEENGKKKAFRLGDKVEVNIQADYYFGGAVSNATVEVLVHQNPFYHWWQPKYEFPWYYEDMTPRYWQYGGQQGQVIKHETLKTDATGKATLTFDTPHGAQQDFEYNIEARVTDASRREISGNATARVTRQRYYVHPRAQHNLYRPQEKVSIDIKAEDANDQPVQTEGTIKVSRDYWYEIWIDPSGKEVQGDELRRLQKRSRVFPPPSDPDSKGWRLKFRGYEHDDILTQTAKTNLEGEAEFTFTPTREGYYRIAWSSKEKEAPPIKAETTVWVTTNTSTELGYRHDGVEIIVDKDTFRAGQEAAVMLSVSTGDRYVLFSIEGENLYSYQLIHVSGTMKLLEIPVEEKHVPNIFLSATMVSDHQIYIDTKQVIVPPVQQFIRVDVKPDREQYQPREEGTLTITTRNFEGKPVSAEVALSLVDESVYYIQNDYALDPRQFYYGSKRWNQVQNQSTFNQKSYAKLIEGPNKELIDEQQLAMQRELQSAGQGGGMGSGSGAGIVEGALGSTIGGGVGGIISKSAVAELEGRMIVPQAAPMNARDFVSSARLEAAEMKAVPAPPSANLVAVVQVRSDFRSTVFWQPDITTDKDGKAIVKVKYPDSLTSWKATARVETELNQFGTANTSTKTKQPLIVRLEAPRFFAVGDSVTISAVINNNTDAVLNVAASLKAEGLDVSGVVRKGKVVSETPEGVNVEANGEARVDWKATARQPGKAKLQITAHGGKFADAMVKEFPIFEHGVEKFVSKSGKVRGDEVVIKFNIPKERKKESTELTVQVTPSLAVTMLDALPYLIDYPYGCTEQTLSRFLPAAITAKTLKDLGLQPDTVMEKVLGGIVRQFADQTHPKGKRDLKQLDEITQQGLKRLYDFQHSDGGWGWWKEGDTDSFMTAYVVWGLTLARDAGIKLKPEVMDRGADYLNKHLVEQETNYDQQAWMLHALSAYHTSSRLSQANQFQSKAFNNLWSNRDQLNAYTRALLALSANNLGYSEQAKTLIRNLENGVKIDKTPDTSVLLGHQPQSSDAVIGIAHWGEDGIYWRWSDGGVEATSFALRALLAIDPQNKLIEPVTNWLIKNRRGAQWSNTRDTAISILVLNDYLRASGELHSNVEYELRVNGHPIITKKISDEDALSAPSQFTIDPQYVLDEVNEIYIKRKSGSSPIYFSTQAKYFSLEEPIPAVGNEIFVRRQYFKLVGRPTLLKGYVYDKRPLNDGDSVTSGDRVQAVLTIESKNNYEYLVFEDLKPAGLEAVEIRSGEPLYAKELNAGAIDRIDSKAQSSRLAGSSVKNQEAKLITPEARIKTADLIVLPNPTEGNYTGRSRWVYQELRDRKVALFIDKLPQGVWEIRYDLRAEVPGHFHALPTLGHAMYVPEIRANGDEVRISVEDKK